MKANEVPEKIYLQVCGDCKDNDCKNCEFAVLEDNVTWCRDKIFEKDVEYTRTDAFIEKACAFLTNEANIPLWEGNNDTFGCDTSKLVQNFKNYMKGE